MAEAKVAVAEVVLCAPQWPAHGTLPFRVTTHLRAGQSLPWAGRSRIWNRGLLYYHITLPPVQVQKYRIFHCTGMHNMPHTLHKAIGPYH
jgi:hypothetical protein